MSALLVKRTSLGTVCTQGELWLDGRLFCYTLEPAKAEPPVKPRAIPPGVYKFEIVPSEEFGFPVLLLEQIPDFEGVEVHPGNFPSDTRGCILVGRLAGTNAVYESREAFKSLMDLVSPGTIEIAELPQEPAGMGVPDGTA